MVTVSVIMSVHKESPEVVSRAVESILGQTLADIEFIIILDWPDNNSTLHYLMDCAKEDKRMTILVNEKNMGQGYSRNRGIDLAKGKYIALQDADDASDPERLAKQYRYLEANPEKDVLGTGFIYYDFNLKKELFRRMYPPEALSVINKISPCGHPSIMTKREIYPKFGYYDTLFISMNGGQVFVEDYDLFIRWHLQGVKIANLQEYLYIYHREDKYIMPKVKGMVKSVVDIKLKYMSKLHFGINDYIYFGMQALTLLLPSGTINWIFKITNYK